MNLRTNLAELLNTTLLELCDYNGDKTVVITNIKFNISNMVITFANNLNSSNYYHRTIPYSELKKVEITI